MPFTSDQPKKYRIGDTEFDPRGYVSGEQIRKAHGKPAPENGREYAVGTGSNVNTLREKMQSRASEYFHSDGSPKPIRDPMPQRDKASEISQSVLWLSLIHI